MGKGTDFVGIDGKKVTELDRDCGIKDFIKSIVVSDPHTIEWKDPFFVLDLGLVKSLMAKWVSHLPSIPPFYAVKCNPDPSLLAYMAGLGSNFDCASQAEIELVISLGISPGRIIFSNPCKPDSHVRYAAKVGVTRTTFDSVHEVEKMKRCFGSGCCQLLIRIKAPDDGLAEYPLGEKFGALPHEVEPLLLAAHSLGIDVVGVSFHVGSSVTDSRAYDSAISSARDVFDAAAKLGMPKMRVLNIGGGFTAGPRFEDAAKAINFAIQTYFADMGLEIIAEPGRYFAERPFTLAANVIGKRVRGHVREYYINDGIFGSLNCVLNNHAVLKLPEPLALESDPENPTRSGSKTHGSTVFGPTCDPLDTVAKDYHLPEMEIGDWLVFPHRGAYSSAGGSNFNGFKGVGMTTHLVYSQPL